MPPCMALKCPAIHLSSRQILARLPQSSQRLPVQHVRRVQTSITSHYRADRPTGSAGNSIDDDGYLDFTLAGLSESTKGAAHHEEPPTETGRRKPASSRKSRTQVTSGSFASSEVPRHARRPSNPPSTRSEKQYTDPLEKFSSSFVEHLSTKRAMRNRARTVARLKAAQHHESKTRRPKFSSLKSLRRWSAYYSSEWETGYARCREAYDKTLKSRSPLRTRDLRLLPKAEHWARRILEETTGHLGDVPLGELASQEGRSFRTIWRNAALWLIAEDKNSVCDFLLATHGTAKDSKHPPINWVEDSMFILASHYAQQDTPDRRMHMKKLIRTFLTLSERKAKDQMQFQNSFVRLLLRDCSIQDAQDILKALKKNHVQVHGNTWHHLSHLFAKNNRLEEALDALLEARSAGSDMHGKIFLSNCSTLLRQSMHHSGGLRMCLKLVDQLVAIGVKLNTHMCSILMLNAVESGDLRTTFSIFDSMIGNSIPLDAVTFAVLLKGCKADLDNAERLKDVIRQAVEHEQVRQNETLAAEILHCLSLHHGKHNPERSFSISRDAYLQLFDPQPLNALGIPMLDDSEVEVATPRLSPQPAVIGMMVAAYLKRVSIREAYGLYLRWRDFVVAGREPFASLASQPVFSTLFLHKFAQHRHSLLYATHVIKDMQRALPTSSNVVQCPPDAIAWSVLLHGISIHGPSRLAEQVLSHMRHVGVEPTTVTWNTMVSHYAHREDIDGLTDTLRRMEQSGSVYDAFTNNNLKRLRPESRKMLEARLEHHRNEAAPNSTHKIGSIHIDDVVNSVESRTEDKPRD